MPMRDRSGFAAEAEWLAYEQPHRRHAHDATTALAVVDRILDAAHRPRAKRRQAGVARCPPGSERWHGEQPPVADLRIRVLRLLALRLQPPQICVMEHSRWVTDPLRSIAVVGA